MRREGRETGRGENRKKGPHLVSLRVETSALTLESFCLRMHKVQVRRVELIYKVKQTPLRSWIQKLSGGKVKWSRLTKRETFKQSWRL